MLSKSTLQEIYKPLMNCPSIKADRCVICGRHRPLEQHHMVWRSWGRLFVKGVEVPKPTITLCGFGNNLADADGRYYCHGLAHHRMLHFRVRDGYLEYLLISHPVNYLTALDMDGWKVLDLNDVYRPYGGGL